MSMDHEVGVVMWWVLGLPAVVVLVWLGRALVKRTAAARRPKGRPGKHEAV